MLNNLTGMRFYASLWVFLFHSIGYIKELDCIFLQKGYLGVDLFFILSGFILTYVYYKSFFIEDITSKKYWNFVVKRFAKIYPMHLITFMMVAAILYLSNHVFLQSEIDLIPSILLMVHSWGFTNETSWSIPSWNVPSWTISSEWFAYLIVFVPFAFLFKMSKKIFIGVIISIAVFFVYKWSQTPNFGLDKPEKLFNFGLERLFPEFVLGMLLGYIRLKIQISKITASAIFLFGLALFLILISGNEKLNLEAFCILPLAGLVFSLSYKTHFDFLFDNKTFLYLGNISFAFYLLQLVPFYLLRKPFVLLDGYGFPVYLLALFKTISLVGFNLILSAFFYKYYEEPVRKLVIDKLSVK